VAALGAMWPVEALLPATRLARLRQWSSTNLDNLRLWPAGHPVEALVTSAFVPQETAWVWPFMAVSAFAAVQALGGWRAVAVLGGVHVGATLVTEAMVWWRIHHGALSHSAAHMVDTGPSYLVVAAMTIALGCARPVWARAVWAVLLVVAAPDLLDGIGSGDAAPVGHVLSFLVGLGVVFGHHWRRRVAPAPAVP
jgi:hypothetical protein